MLLGISLSQDFNQLSASTNTLQTQPLSETETTSAILNEIPILNKYSQLKINDNPEYKINNSSNLLDNTSNLLDINTKLQLQGNIKLIQCFLNSAFFKFCSIA